MENNNNFKCTIGANTAAERRKIAAKAMYAMLSNGTYAKSFSVTDIAELAICATDTLIKKLNKEKQQ